MALVSIIIPTHNRAPLLARVIESAKGAGADAEVVVVDDASTDETPEVCRAIPDIRYVRLERNVRQAGARNAGIAASSGEYLAFLDDDDLRLPGSLDPQISLLNSEPGLGFVYGRVQFGDPEGCVPTGETSPDECLTGDLFWRLLEGNFIHIPSVVTRRKLVEAAGLFDPTVTGVEDWMMLIRIAERHLVGAVEEPVAIYRTFTSQSGQTSSNRIAMCQASARALAKGLHLPRALAAPARKRREVRQRHLDSLSSVLVDYGIEALLRGKYILALQGYLTALRLNPARAARPYTFKRLLSELRLRGATPVAGGNRL